jgi:GTPase
MLPQENEEGNIEYKRHLCSDELKILDNDNNVRFQQLVTQMKYRLNEGNGMANYYIGVEDNGSLYKLSKEQRRDSILMIKRMVLYLEGKIESLIFNNGYIKVTIKDKFKYIRLVEKRILLLGDTESGKTTFLAYLIKNKLDTEFCKSRLFILNHKHELESGKTSSYNYQYKNHNDSKYVFIDTPGESNKIRNKILLSFNFDLILFFDKPNEIWNKKELFVSYANFMNIPYLNLNMFDTSSMINLITPIVQDDMLNIFESNFKNNDIQNSIVQNSIINDVNSNCIFYLLQSYPNVDMGWILSGYLASGCLKIDQELLWYDNDKVKVKINSIYQNNLPINRCECIYGPATITITLKDIDNIDNKPRFGFLSNIDYVETKFVKIIWVYFNNDAMLYDKEFVIHIKNFTIKVKQIGDSEILMNEYQIISQYPCYNILNSYFIYDKDETLAIGKLIDYF